MKLSSLKYLIKEGIKNLWTNRLMSVASVGVLICCLLLLGSAALVALNVNSMLGWAKEQNTINVYLKLDVTEQRATEIGEEFREIPNVSNVTFVSKEDALKIMEDMLGEDKTVLEGLDGDNPLSYSYTIQMDDLTKLDSIITHIKTVDGVDVVKDQRDVTEKLIRIRDVVLIGGMWVIILLALISLFIIVNTIKLTMFGRRLEIGIMKSVGATDNFVRLPFVIEGMAIGILSGLVSFGVLWYGYTKIDGFVFDTLATNMVPFDSVLWPMLGCFVGTGVLIGMLGSGFSIRRFLRKEGGQIIG